jgi:predicted metal-dependent hydrolase
VKSALRFIRRLAGPAQAPPQTSFTLANGTTLPLAFVRNAKARRYILRLRHDGTARVTVPRTGSLAEAQRFLERQRPWLERQHTRLAQRPPLDERWTVGTEILFRGNPVHLAHDPVAGTIRFADQFVPVSDPLSDLKPALQRHLWRLAARELPPRVQELAALHGLRVQRVSIRNQRSRWGSCSVRATISLNWRILHAPDPVRDYLILHELMHLRQMNHSAKYWDEVERVCPDYRTAEAWLKEHNRLLH